MKFRQLLPVAISIAFISSVYVLFAQTLQIAAMWLPFISWTAYCLDGAKPKRLPRLLICFTGGMLVGAATVSLVSPVSRVIGPTFALPLIVFFLVILILLSELVKPADSIPSYFFAYSSYFAFYYGKFGGESGTPTNIIPLFWLLVVLGFGLGILTSEIRNNLIKEV